MLFNETYSRAEKLLLSMGAYFLAGAGSAPLLLLVFRLPVLVWAIFTACAGTATLLAWSVAAK